MAVTQYIGARYVPLFADPIEWSSTKSYEPLTVVTYQGASYTSKQAVPVGIDITNADFWTLTGNYNAQVEQYRQEVRMFDARITEAQGDATDAKDAAESAQDSADAANAILAGYAEGDTVKADISALQTAIGNVDTKIGTLPEGETDVVSYVDGEVQGINTDLDGINDTLVGFDTENPVKPYVDTQIADAKTDILRNPTNMSEIRWNVASRHFRPEGYLGVQGFCVFTVAGVDYWAQGDINTDSDGRVDIYRLDSHALVGSVSGNFGHIHGMSYVDGKIYVDATVAGSAARYVCISVQNPASPVVLTQMTTIPTVQSVSRTCFISDTVVYLVQFSTGNVWSHDLSSGEETLVCVLETGDMTGITLQDFSYDAERNLFVVGTYHKAGVAIFDAETGKRINFIDVPTLVNHVQLQESEGAYIHDGKLYVNASEAASVLRLATLIYWDFERGTAVNTLEMRPAQSVDERYLRVSVTDTGDLVNPTQNNFRLASDAVNLMHSQDDSFSLHIHVLGTTYSYPIILQNVFGTVEWDESACEMLWPIIVIGGNVNIVNLGNVTFDNTSDYTSAVSVFNGVVTIGSIPAIAGSYVRDVYANYGSTINLLGNVTPHEIILARSVCFAKASTNITLQSSSMVYVN